MLIGAVPPLLLQTAANPGGLPMEACDQIRSAVLADRAQFFKDISLPFYGYNRPRANVSQGVRDSFWLQGMMAGLSSAYFCIKVVSEMDLSEGLQQFNVPPLILHGDDDQIVPIGASALLSSTIVKYATLKVYPGAPHGLASTHKDQLNADLLAFLKAQRLLPAIASRAFLHCEPQYLPAPPGLPGGPIVNDQEITTYLAASHIAVVATVHRNGRPHLTPNWYRYDGQVLTLVTRKDRLKYRHLQRDNRISVCIYDPPAASNYVVITGTATCDDQDIWDEARRIIERYRAPDQVDDYVARWKTEPRVLITVTPERIATRGAGRR